VTINDCVGPIYKCCTWLDSQGKSHGGLAETRESYESRSDRSVTWVVIMPARTPAGDVVATDFGGKPTDTLSLGAQVAGGEAAVVGATSLRRKDDVSMNPKKGSRHTRPPQNWHLSQVTTPRVTCLSTPTSAQAAGFAPPTRVHLSIR
jgi:hypothetical protein